MGYIKLGLVSSSNPSTSQIKVLLQPENAETGWIPWCTPWVGNGFGWYSPPNAGDHVMVVYQEGSKDVPIGALGLYWAQAQPPQNVALGESIMQHSTGSFIKFSNNGDITINTDGDLTATVGGDLNITASTGAVNITSPTINFNGNVVISGDLSANNGNITMSDGTFNTNQNIVTSTDVIASGVSLTTHVHSGVTTGGSNTGGPI